MTEPGFSSEEREVQAAIIAFPDHKISWAGEGILDGSFLYGTHNGIVRVSGIDAPAENSRPFRIAHEAEAINSMAYVFLDNEMHLAASTRSEIVLYRFSDVDGTFLRSYQCEFGAHGIKTTLGNSFICPAGPTGLVALFMNRTGEYVADVLPTTWDLPYFYDCALLGHDAGTEVLVVACRSSGLLYSDVSKKGKPFPIKVSKVVKNTFDFVGVLSIGNTQYPLAFIALGKDRSLHFLRDPLQSPHMPTLHFPHVPGTAYKLIRYKNHLLLLTSKGLCLIADIVRQFHDGEELEGYRTVTFLRIEAVDFNTAFDRWLLIVTPDGVVRMDLTELFAQSETIIPEAILRRIRPSLPLSRTPNGDLGEIRQPIWRPMNVGLLEITV